MFIIFHHYISNPEEQVLKINKPTKEEALKYFRRIYPINPIIRIEENN